MKRTADFQTIRSEGGLLPPDLLRRVLDPAAKLDGTRPEDYGLPQGERINEVITQSWNRLRKYWGEFRAATSILPEGEPGTGLTNDKWSLPLLRELGFGLLPTIEELVGMIERRKSRLREMQRRYVWLSTRCLREARAPYMGQEGAA